MAKIFKTWWEQDKETIYIPMSLKTDVEGFSFLSQFHNKTIQPKHYLIDFENCNWLEANLCAILGASIHLNTIAGSKFSIVNLIGKNKIKHTLRNNGFLEFVLNEKANKKDHTGIPFAMYDMKNEDKFEAYIYKYILSSSNIPAMSEGAKKKIYRSIFELYQNSVMHSGADQIYVCGQYYLYKGRLALTMVEFGRTFKQNVQFHLTEQLNISGSQCIEWAVKSGNTTKKLNEAGGLGLDLIREFLKLNNGKLQINSAEGYWEEKKGVTFAQECDFHFPGSIVNIEFNLYDKSNYFTREELNITDIL